MYSRIKKKKKIRFAGNEMVESIFEGGGGDGNCTERNLSYVPGPTNANKNCFKNRLKLSIIIYFPDATFYQ